MTPEETVWGKSLPAVGLSWFYGTGDDKVVFVHVYPCESVLGQHEGDGTQDNPALVRSSETPRRGTRLCRGG